LTAEHGITAIGRANVPIVAVGGRTAHTGSARTGIGSGAGITVIASSSLVSGLREAGVADLIASPHVAGVIESGAVGRAPPSAEARAADLTRGAELAVVAQPPFVGGLGEARVADLIAGSDIALIIEG
jgi:hypothetical protein